MSSDRTGHDTTELLLLWAARETGVLDALMASAGTPAEVAEGTGVTERAARIVVRALDDLGYVERVGDEYQPADPALGFLAKADLRSVGATPRELDVVGTLARLPETMRTGEPPGRHDHWTENRLGARDATDDATVRAAVTAAVREAPDAERVLDVYGAPGTYAREFAERGLAATVFDRPDRLAVARPLLAAGPVAAVEGTSLAELSGAAPSDAPSDGFDLAFCAGVVSERGPDENAALFGALHDAVDPGGTVVVVDHLRGRSPAATATAVRALARTEAGDAHTPDAVTDWLAAAGFEGTRVADVPGTDRQAVAADRPRD